MLFIGVDVHLKSTMVAGINENLDVYFIKQFSIEDLINNIKDLKPMIVAIDAPYCLNKGLMNNDDCRNTLSKNLRGHYNKKVSEYELSRRGIIPFSTPGDISEITGWKQWMKTGFELYGRLEEIGYSLMNDDNMDRVKKGIVEVFPHASFTTLAGHILESKSTGDGLEERIRMLEELGLKSVRSTITGSKHVKADKLDALVAAYTALFIYKGQCSFMGDITEGQIAVPVKTIRDKYRKINKGTITDLVPEDADVVEMAIGKQFNYIYNNLDSVIWLKHFSPMAGEPDIYSILNFAKEPKLKVNVKIESLDADKSIEVVLEPIMGSVHGMKVIDKYKEVLKNFWGSSGDRKQYVITLSMIENEGAYE